MALCLSFLIATLPSFHPQAPIQCRQYLPGTNQVLPAGVNYQYTKEEKLMNDLRCFCEIVKPAEVQCITRGIEKRLCVAKTRRWVTANVVFQGQPGIANIPTRKNVIVNIQPTP